jgi:hypothetical protein
VCALTGLAAVVRVRECAANGDRGEWDVSAASGTSV